MDCSKIVANRRRIILCLVAVFVATCALLFLDIRDSPSVFLEADEVHERPISYGESTASANVLKALKSPNASIALRNTLPFEVRRSLHIDFEMWKNRTVTLNDCLAFAQTSRYISVLVVKNGKLEWQAGLNSNFWSIALFIQMVNQVVDDARKLGVQDKVLREGAFIAVNGGDEPEYPIFEQPSCVNSGIPDQVKSFHGFPWNQWLLKSRHLASSKISFPVLSATKIPGCYGDILIPHVDLVNPHTYKKYKGNETSYFPFKSNARSLAVWRGSTTGRGFQSRRSHRLRLVKHCVENPNICDAIFTGIAQWEHVKSMYVKKNAIVSLDGIQKWKYLMDIDGNSYSRRTASLAQIPGVLLRIGVFDDLFLRMLTPNHDYLRINLDLSDLDSTVQRLNANSTLRDLLNRNKQVTFHQLMSLDRMKAYTIALLHRYSALLVT